MPYTFDEIFAKDISNPGVVARNASIKIFDPADPAKAPIAILDTTGSPLPNPITVDAQGMGPAFQHPTLARVGWEGGGKSNYLTSYEGMYNETQGAKTAAQAAANDAATAAADRVTSATVNGSGKLILTKGTGATVDAGSVIGPKGDKGDKGADGSNVLPTQQAIVEAITNDGPAKTATAQAIKKERNALTMPARGAVMFSLDDNYAQNTELMAVHDALGQKITLAITSSWVDQPNRLTSAQILAYHHAGHEIANHSTTHKNYVSSTAAVRAYESDTCSQFIYNLTGRWPSTFVYPQGAWNATTDQELYTRFRSWALTCSAGTNAPLTYPLGDTFPRFYRLDLDNPANLDRAKQLVRMAAYAPVVVSFYTHWTNQPGTMTTAQYQSIAQLAYDLNVPAVLPRDVFGRESYLLDPSFESPAGSIGNAWGPANTGAATTMRVAATPDAGMSGTHCMQLTAAYPDTAKVVQGVNMTPGGWRMSGRVKLVSGNLITNDVGVMVRYRRADESALSAQTVYPTMPANGVWSRFAFDLTVPALTRLAYLELFVTPGATNSRSGVVLLDHVDLRPAEHGDFG
ncbi:polysaccharide deacetylase family protein [Pseudarthrobacter sp. NamE5]|uniref:polysaccharide deacetylase family protein n=1 Tax=Pseudarthrobacter sp. NamE5 TaxID=2576839 RepID=UPI00110C1538|nr:polysaccharide deacetylase family protein [Pseudarthrobacter sp. NamE5]TLM87200.1 hypothetical protein FDW84_05230 [Pseudarthrobacter sp. NamE5]